ARVAREVDILLDSASGALARSTTYAYDQYMNVITRRDYAYVTLDLPSGQTAAIGSISLGSDMRTEYTTYVTTQSYLDRNLVSLPLTKRVWNAGETTAVERTDLFYDEALYPPLTYGGTIVGWTDPGTPRGNLTTVQRFLSISSTSDPVPTDQGVYVNVHTQYDQAGSPRYIWDAKGNQSQIEYSASFQYAYPTHTISPAPTGGAAPATITRIHPPT